jgi:hypothetical protein
VVRLAAFAAIAVVVAGCGGDEATRRPSTGADAAATVRRAGADLRSAGTFGFDLRVVRTRSDRPARPATLIAAAGDVDLRADAGSMRVDLSGLLAGEGDEANATLERPVALEWTGLRMVARVAGQRRALPRARARVTGGLLGRMPDEPAVLVGMVAGAREVRELGSGTVDGDAATRYAFPLPGRAGKRLTAFAGDLSAQPARPRVPTPSVQVWIDSSGALRRIAYLVDLPAVNGPTASDLPPRTVTATYDLRDIGA